MNGFSGSFLALFAAPGRQETTVAGGRFQEMFIVCSISHIARYIAGLNSEKLLHVIGNPKINLLIISWRIANSKENPGVLKWTLPLEMIIAAIVEEQRFAKIPDISSFNYEMGNIK